MGAGFSSSGGVEISEETSALLASFAGPATRAHSDPLWASLLASCDDAPLASIDPRRLERALRPTCVALCRHDRKTAHLTTLLLHAARLVRAVRADQAETPTRAVNAVVFATTLLKHLVEFGDAGAFARACASPPAEGGSTHTTTVMRTFLEACVEAIARRDSPSEHCYVLHLACARALTVACATALFADASANASDADARVSAKHPGFAALAETCAETRADWVSNRASANATDALIAALASRVAERAPPPKPGSPTARASSAERRGGYGLRGAARRKTPSLAARFASAFSFSFTTGSADRDDDAMRGTTPLADACARLFLVLVTFPALANPFREAARACADAAEPRRDAERAAGTERNERNERNDATFRAEQQQHARVPRESRAWRAEPRARGGGPRRVTRDAERVFGVGRAAVRGAAFAFFGHRVRRVRVARALAAGVRRRGGEAGRHHARARAHLGATTVSARRRAPRLATALPGRSRRVAATPRPRPRPDRRPPPDAFADEHAYAALPLALVLTSDEGFVEAARRRDSESAGLGPVKTPSQTPSPAQSRTVLTALFGALARLARRGGFGALKASGSSSDAASASAVFARALALGALANIAPRCARVDAATAGKLVGALDAFERRERAFRRASSPDEPLAPEALAVGDLVCLVLEVLNSAVTHAASANPELVYALLHRRDLFEPRDSDEAHDGFGGFGEEANVEDAPGRSSAESFAATRANLRGNLRRMLAHLDEKIEVSNAYVTAERVMEMAARAASSFEPEHAEGAVRFEPTPFAYASSPDAARTFFAPLAWRLVVEQEGFQWDETTLAGGMLGRAVGEAL
jgi:hypothetical protein